jgi:RsiW-degrading membrane proteinase PrsW (M82 family)
VAEFTQGFWLRGRGIITLIFYILKFIGFSYRSALDPDSNFFLSFMGFTCGVGFCEELAKALPMLRHYRTEGKLGWRAACMMGLASGIGFGVSEGITYASDFYNGYSTGGIYVVRFVSCVALHAIWSAAVGIAIYNRRDYFKGEMAWDDWAKSLLWVLGVPMVLHGLYDTMLKKEMNALALVTALVSFGFLVWLIEWARSEETTLPAAARAAA